MRLWRESPQFFSNFSPPPLAFKRAASGFYKLFDLRELVVRHFSFVQNDGEADLGREQSHACVVGVQLPVPVPFEHVAYIGVCIELSFGPYAIIKQIDNSFVRTVLLRAVSHVHSSGKQYRQNKRNDHGQISAGRVGPSKQPVLREERPYQYAVDQKQHRKGRHRC